MTLRAKAAISARYRRSSQRGRTVPGSDPKLKDEYVVMSAHLDHVGIGRAGERRHHLQRRHGRRVRHRLDARNRAPHEGDGRQAEAVDHLSGASPPRKRASWAPAISRRTRPCPPSNIVADINLDMFLPLYPLKVIEVQGLTESTLGDQVRAAAKESRRRSADRP